jgi:hypothetical protein
VQVHRKLSSDDEQRLFSPRLFLPVWVALFLHFGIRGLGG